jgi:hypothetical protein
MTLGEDGTSAKERGISSGWEGGVRLHSIEQRKRLGSVKPILVVSELLVFRLMLLQLSLKHAAAAA